MSSNSHKAGNTLPASPSQRPDCSENWWHGAVIYQVYPRSFKDSSGDGVGDLRGCIEGLDHIASLGVDALWLSPFFKSPMDDFGYDISDYLAVDPLFGNLDDFEELVAEAHKRDLKVIIDQVYSHTSNQHPWFEESRKDKTNPKANWYVWADPKADGSPPNNWQSVFGGCSWEWDNNRRQYYLHNFLTSQPDLNVHNQDVQEALLDVARFWLDKGVDGFRIDAINFAMHDPELKDNPPVKTFMRPPTRPFDFQEHIYNQSHPDIVCFLEKVRALTDSYPNQFTVAEVGGSHALKEMKLFTQGEKGLNSAYSFEYLYADDLTPELVQNTMNDWPEAAGNGWPSWAFSNHDAPRAQSRWVGDLDGQDFAKFIMLLLMSMRGNVFIYQGEELGLPQAEIPFEKLQDPEAIANWPETLGRDGARTPIPWQEGAENAGFSVAEPWLPIDKSHFPYAIDGQNKDENSTLNFTRQLISLRAEHSALRLGGINFISSPDGLLAFIRDDGQEQVLCVFNLSSERLTWSPENSDKWSLLRGVNIDTAGKDKLPTSLAAGSGYLTVLG